MSVLRCASSAVDECSTESVYAVSASWACGAFGTCPWVEECKALGMLWRGRSWARPTCLSRVDAPYVTTGVAWLCAAVALCPHLQQDDLFMRTASRSCCVHVMSPESTSYHIWNGHALTGACHHLLAALNSHQRTHLAALLYHAQRSAAVHVHACIHLAHAVKL